MKLSSAVKHRFSGAQKAQPVHNDGTRFSSAEIASITSGASYEMIAERVLRKIDGQVAADMAKPALIVEIEKLVAQIANEERIEINGREQQLLAVSIVDDFKGYGPIEEALADESITEIMINGPKTVFIERAGKIALSNITFRSEAHLRGIAVRIARYIGRRLDDQQPYVDARLPDGSRVNIVIPPVAIDGTCVSIRKFPLSKMRLEDLVKFGSMSREMSIFLEAISAARCNIIVSGGTSSGKTTILNAMSDFIRQNERVVTIEDSAELQLNILNVVRMETRTASSEAGSKAITQRDLVANSLRMRPDRIIIGEVRREEAFDLLQAMSTGHDGSMGTIHSNSPRDTCSRLENMILMTGVELPIKVIRAQISSSIDFIVHAARGPDGRRRVVAITEILGLEGDVITLQDIFYYEYGDGRRPGAGRFLSNPVNIKASDKLRSYGHFEDAVNAIAASQKA